MSCPSSGRPSPVMPTAVSLVPGRVFVNCMNSDHASCINGAKPYSGPSLLSPETQAEETALALSITV